MRTGADRAGELGEGDDHAAEQEQHEVQAVLGGEVDLTGQAAGEAQAKTGEAHRAEDDGDDRERPVR